MRVEFTRDASYPISISDTYNKTYINRFTVYDDDDWNDFINALNQYRNEYLRKLATEKE